MKLDTASINVNFPINQWFALGPMVYRSLYCGDVPVGGGLVFHIPKLNLHAAPHVFKLNDSIAAPVPVFWTPKIGDRVSLLLKVITITNHGLLEKPAPFIGGEGGINVKILKGFNAFGKAFFMSVRDPQGNIFIGPASFQGGIEVSR
jgi:hypothetical protein